MSACYKCGVPVAGAYCSVCGARTLSTAAVAVQQTYDVPPRTPTTAVPHLSAKGFGQIFGIDPKIAFLTLLIDMMLFGGEAVTFGAILPLSIAAGIVLGFITYRTQMRWYGDDQESALIKGAILGLLTAIPTSLPAVLYLSSGAVGFLHKLRRK